MLGWSDGWTTPPNAAQATSTFEYTQNMHPLGLSAREIPLDNTVPGAVSNSALAFWGDMAVRGTYAGFSDPTDPDVIGFVDTPCGSHTETLVPDLENGRLLVYSNSSANTILGGNLPPDSPPTCRGIDIIEVCRSWGGASSWPVGSKRRYEDHPGVMARVGDANLVACAGRTSAIGGNGVTVFSMDPADGGSDESGTADLVPAG